MGLLTFSINVTLDGCVDHQDGVADEETHAFFTRLMDENEALLWGRVTYWPAVARGDGTAPQAMREWAVKLEDKPKYVVSSTRKDFPWTNSDHIAGDLRAGVQKLKDATPAGVLLGSGKLATGLERLDLIDEYKFLVHPRIAGHGPTPLPERATPRAMAGVRLGKASPQRHCRYAHAMMPFEEICRRKLGRRSTVIRQTFPEISRLFGQRYRENRALVAQMRKDQFCASIKTVSRFLHDRGVTPNHKNLVAYLERPQRLRCAWAIAALNEVRTELGYYDPGEQLFLGIDPNSC